MWHPQGSCLGWNHRAGQRSWAPTGHVATGAAAMLLALDDLAGEVHLAERRQLAALVDRLPRQRFR
jgi:hypothetical protein